MLIVRMTRWLFIVLSGLVFFQPSVTGEHKLKVVTLQDAVRIALERNQDLATTRLETKRADERVQEAWGTALPSVDLQGRYTRALKKPVFFLPDFEDLQSGRIIPIEVGSNHAFDMTINVTQVLFNAAVVTGVGAAKIYSRGAREMYRAKELETVTKVRKAFYTVLLAAEVRDLMRANLRNAEENLANVRLLSQQGIISEYDELRAEVGVENVRPAVTQAENNYALALDALRIVMGIGTSEEFELDGRLQHEPVDETLLTDASDLVVQTNADLQAMRYQLGIYEALVNIERSDYLPTLAAFGNYQYQAAKNSLNVSTNDFVRSSLVGLTLSLNIFKGWQTNARVEQAKLELRKSEEQYASLEMGLRTAAHSVVLRIREAQKRIDAQGKTVEQAEKGYRIATTRFLSGSGTQLEINDAQLALTQAKVNRIQGVYDYLVAAAELDQILGRLPDYATP